MAIHYSAASPLMNEAGKLEPVRRFLLGVAALVAIAVIVGGGTRLTESGLSITEWNVVSGILPPLDATVWLDEFEKYRRTQQYRELNLGMTLSDFQSIYLWEWAHRLIGRVIGAVFLIGFVWHLLRRAYAFKSRLGLRLFSIGLLIALQGGVGWWMVRSGLFERVNVAPYRLAIHLTLASVIFALLYETALSLKSPAGRAPLTSHWPRALLLGIFVQIFLGALVAGNRAGYAFQTWPLMDGAFIPPTLLQMEPWWRNLFENAAMVQFLHRSTAYALLIAAVIQVVILLWQNAKTQASALRLLVVLLAQAGLGIATLLTGVELVVALLHQAGLLIVVMVALQHLDQCRAV